MTCSVPYCDQDAVTRLGYCVPHAALPYHVGQVLHCRPDANSRQTEARTIAEVDLKRKMLRFQGDQGWIYPASLCTQTAPTPKAWLDLEQTEEWKAGNRRMAPDPADLFPERCRGIYVRVLRATLTKSRRRLDEGRLFQAVDDLDPNGWVAVIFRGRVEHVKVGDLGVVSL